MMLFLLFIISLLWGSTFIYSKILLDSFSVSFIVACRFSVAFVLFAIIFGKKVKFSRRLLKNGSIIGVINGLALVVQLLGLQYTTASNAAFLTTTYILFVPFIEYFIWETKVTRAVVYGIIIAIFGVYVLSFKDLTSFSMNIGDVITIGCGFIYALQIFFISHYTKVENTYGLVFMQFLISSLVGILYLAYEMLFGGYSIPTECFSDTSIVINLLVLSVVATFIPFSLQFYVQKYVTPTAAGVAYLMEPVFALILAMTFLNENIGIQSGIGIVLVFIGVIIVNRGQKGTN